MRSIHIFFFSLSHASIIIPPTRFPGEERERSAADLRSASQALGETNTGRMGATKYDLHAHGKPEYSHRFYWRRKRNITRWTQKKIWSPGVRSNTYAMDADRVQSINGYSQWIYCWTITALSPHHSGNTPHYHQWSWSDGLDASKWRDHHVKWVAGVGVRKLMVVVVIIVFMVVKLPA